MDGQNKIRDADDLASDSPVQDRSAQEPSDLPVWLIWGGIMLIAFAALPFVVRGQELFRTLAVMCGFDVGSPGF
jgi:hypothetical protein